MRPPRRRTRSQTQSQNSQKVYKEADSESSDEGSYVACSSENPSQIQDESQLFTPGRSGSPESDKARSSERIRGRKNRQFTMPSREDVFNKIEDEEIESPSKKTPTRYRSSKINNRFSRTTHSYNQDYLSDNEGSSLDEFLVDDDLVSESASSDDGAKGNAKSVSKVRRRILQQSSSSGEEDGEAQMGSAKKRRRIFAPASSSEEETQDPNVLPSAAAPDSGLLMVTPDTISQEDQSQTDEVQSDASESLISQTSLKKKNSLKNKTDTSLITGDPIEGKEKLVKEVESESYDKLLVDGNTDFANSKLKPLEVPLENDNKFEEQGSKCGTNQNASTSSKETSGCHTSAKAEGNLEDAKTPAKTEYYPMFNIDKKWSTPSIEKTTKGSASPSVNEDVEALSSSGAGTDTSKSETSESGTSESEGDSDALDLSRSEYMQMKKDEWRSKFDLYKEKRAKRKKST